MNSTKRKALYRRFVKTFHFGEPPAPVSFAQLDEAERVLGTMFPTSYRLFMTSYGELYTPNLFHLVPGLPETPDLQNLASLEEVVSEAPGLWSGGTPNNLVVIGNDIMGNLFCLPRTKRRRERPDDLPIKFFDHEFLDVAVVANSFDEWLSRFLQLKHKKR